MIKHHSPPLQARLLLELPPVTPIVAGDGVARRLWPEPKRNLQPAPPPKTVAWHHWMDAICTATPFCGSRQLAVVWSYVGIVDTPKRGTVYNQPRDVKSADAGTV